MPLKTYDTQDAVPEPQRATAVELKSGKWGVVEPEKTDADVAALSSTLDKEREKRKAEEKRAKAAEDKAAELESAAEAAGKGVTKEALDDIRAKEALARKPIEDERDRLALENRKLKLDDRVRALALSKGVMPDRIDKAMRDLAGRVDLTDDGADIVVKDAKGKPTAQTIDDFLTTSYKAEAPFFYEGTNAAGSGATTSQPGGGGNYDPVAAGKAAAADQKKTAEQQGLAFK